MSTETQSFVVPVDHAAQKELSSAIDFENWQQEAQIHSEKAACQSSNLRATYKKASYVGIETSEDTLKTNIVWSVALEDGEKIFKSTLTKDFRLPEDLTEGTTIDLDFVSFPRAESEKKSYLERVKKALRRKAPSTNSTVKLSKITLCTTDIHLKRKFPSDYSTNDEAEEPPVRKNLKPIDAQQEPNLLREEAEINQVPILFEEQTNSNGEEQIQLITEEKPAGDANKNETDCIEHERLHIDLLSSSGSEPQDEQEEINASPEEERTNRWRITPNLFGPLVGAFINFFRSKTGL